MMAVFNLIFLGLLLLAATAVVWAIWSLFATIFARRMRRMVLIGLPASAAIVIAGVAGLWVYESRPAAIFAGEFGFAPPADVVFVNSYTFALGDSGSTYLQLRAGPATVDRMVASAGLMPGAILFSTNARPT